MQASAAAIPVDCRGLFRTACDAVERLAGGKVEFDLQLPTQPTMIAASAEDFVDVVVSVLNLSCDSMVANDSARVVARVSDATTVDIEIGDNGPGFAGDELSAAFLGSSEPPTPAAIALADCSRRVARLGGQFQVESRLGEGTRYTVSLPSVTET